MADDDLDLGDDDLDLDGLESEFGGDELEGIEDPDMESREPDVGFARGAVGSFVDTYTEDPTETIKNIVKNAVPESLSAESDVATNAYNTITDKLQSESNKLRKTAKSTIRSFEKLAPEDSMLGNALGSIANFVGPEEEETSGYSTAGPSIQDKVNSELESLLGATQEQAIDREEVRDNIEDSQNADNRDIQVVQATNIERIRKFMLESTNQFHRSSLTVGLKQLFNLEELVTVTKSGFDVFTTALNTIAKNTGLPDANKINTSELFQHKMTEKVVGGIGSGIFNKTGLIERATNKASSIVSEYGESARGAMEEASGLSESLGMGSEMGMSASQTAGGLIGDLAQAAMGKALGKTVGKTDTGKKTIFGIKEFFADPAKALKKIASGDSAFSGVAGATASLAGSEKTNFKIDRVNPNEASYFDNKTKDSITKIIPELLSKIYGEVKTSRMIQTKVSSSGNKGSLKRLGIEGPTDHELVYDDNEARLVNKNKYVSDIVKRVDEDTQKTVSPQADSVVVEFLKDAKTEFTKEDFKAVRSGVVYATINKGEQSTSMFDGSVKKYIRTNYPDLLPKYLEQVKVFNTKVEKDGEYQGALNNRILGLKNSATQHENAARELHSKGLSAEAVDAGLLTRDNGGNLSGNRKATIDSVMSATAAADIKMPDIKKEALKDKLDGVEGFAARNKVRLQHVVDDVADKAKEDDDEDDNDNAVDETTLNSPKDVKPDDALTNIVNANPALGSHSKGDYTSDGPANEVAGIVHRAEYVIPKPDLKELIQDVSAGNIEGIKDAVGAIAKNVSDESKTFNVSKKALDEYMDADIVSTADTKDETGLAVIPNSTPDPYSLKTYRDSIQNSGIAGPPPSLIQQSSINNLYPESRGDITVGSDLMPSILADDSKKETPTLVDKLLGPLDNIYKELKDNVSPGITTGFDKLTPTLKDGLAVVSNQFTTFSKDLIPELSKTMDTVKTGFSTAIDKIGFNKLLDGIEKQTSIISKSSEYYQSTLKFVTDKVPGVAVLKENATAAWDKTKEAYNENGVSAVGTLAKDKANKVIDSNKTLKSIKTTAVNATKEYTDTYTKDGISGVGTLAKDKANSALEKVSTFTGVGAKDSDGKYKPIGPAIANASKSVTAFINTGTDSVAKFGTGLVNKVTAADKTTGMRRINEFDTGVSLSDLQPDTITTTNEDHTKALTLNNYNTTTGAPVDYKHSVNNNTYNTSGTPSATYYGDVGADTTISNYGATSNNSTTTKVPNNWTALSVPDKTNYTSDNQPLVINKKESRGANAVKQVSETIAKSETASQVMSHAKKFKDRATNFANGLAYSSKDKEYLDELANKAMDGDEDALDEMTKFQDSKPTVKKTIDKIKAKVSGAVTSAGSQLKLTKDAIANDADLTPVTKTILLKVHKLVGNKINTRDELIEKLKTIKISNSDRSTYTEYYDKEIGKSSTTAGKAINMASNAANVVNKALFNSMTLDDTEYDSVDDLKNAKVKEYTEGKETDDKGYIGAWDDLTKEEQSSLRTTFFASDEYKMGLVRSFSAWVKEYARLDPGSLESKAAFIKSMLFNVKNSIMTPIGKLRDEIVTETLERLTGTGLKELTLDQEGPMREEFFKSDEYVSGNVTKFGDWLEAQGYKKNGSSIFTRIKKALSLRTLFKKTRALDRKIMGGAYKFVGKQIVKAPANIAKGLYGTGKLGLAGIGNGASAIANTSSLLRRPANLVAGVLPNLADARKGAGLAGKGAGVVAKGVGKTASFAGGLVTDMVGDTLGAIPGMGFLAPSRRPAAIIKTKRVANNAKRAATTIANDVIDKSSTTVARAKALVNKDPVAASVPEENVKEIAKETGANVITVPVPSGTLNERIAAEAAKPAEVNKPVPVTPDSVGPITHTTKGDPSKEATKKPKEKTTEVIKEKAKEEKATKATEVIKEKAKEEKAKEEKAKEEKTEEKTTVNIAEENTKKTKERLPEKNPGVTKLTETETKQTSVLSEILQLWKNRDLKETEKELAVAKEAKTEDKREAKEAKKEARKKKRTSFFKRLTSKESDDDSNPKKAKTKHKLLKKALIGMGTAGALYAIYGLISNGTINTASIMNTAIGIKDGIVTTYETIKKLYHATVGGYEYLKQLPARFTYGMQEMFSKVGFLGVDKPDASIINNLDDKLKTARGQNDSDKPLNYLDKKTSKTSDTSFIAKIDSKVTKSAAVSALMSGGTMNTAKTTIYTDPNARPVFKFSKHSKELLYGTDERPGVHSEIVKLATLALNLSSVEFSIIQGYRTTAEQAKLYKAKRSNADGVKHLSDHQKGMAIDIYPVVTVNGKKLDPFKISSPIVKYVWAEVYKAFAEASRKLGLVLGYGYNYSISGSKDWDHISLKGKDAEAYGVLPGKDLNDKDPTATDSPSATNSNTGSGHGVGTAIVAAAGVGAAAYAGVKIKNGMQRTGRVIKKVYGAGKTVASVPGKIYRGGKWVTDKLGGKTPEVKTPKVKAPKAKTPEVKASEKPKTTRAKYSPKQPAKQPAELKSKRSSFRRSVSKPTTSASYGKHASSKTGLAEKLKKFLPKLKSRVILKLGARGAAKVILGTIAKYAVPFLGWAMLLVSVGTFLTYLYKKYSFESAASMAIIGVDLFSPESDDNKDDSAKKDSVDNSKAGSSKDVDVTRRYDPETDTATIHKYNKKTGEYTTNDEPATHNVSNSRLHRRHDNNPDSASGNNNLSTPSSKTPNVNKIQPKPIQNVTVTPNIIVKPVIKIPGAEHMKDMAEHTKQAVNLQTQMVNILGDISNKLDRQLGANQTPNTADKHIEEQYPTEHLPEPAIDLRRRVKF